MVLLHGYTGEGPAHADYFGAPADAERAGYYLLTPNGTIDSRGNRFWNAMPGGCCDFDGSGVDDVAYLTALVDEAVNTLPVDEDRIYFTGHSNGGYMSYRMACELSDRVAAIMSLAGGDYWSETACVPSQPVSVLHVHGDADDTVSFESSTWSLGAHATTKRWALRAGCDDVETTGAALDIESSLAGAETLVTEWRTGCDARHSAALWRIVDGSHVPRFDRNRWMPAVSDWLLAHER